ncbi:hypothetical protein SPRG_21459 [Saprolegnia parasitica CBS 223.65]|uniref:Uncharacterized protein n=1 Tax=Saprolegnia parasitica (strain CBS 223.65) TaxID=695850 RepID=A0A067BMM9_SAPPC|nr:hypothetical protein SPRG_21459 [Saprolegnia parasitica CBS 223.65]KDO19699.1 hypothetical protein SPRG_21459 [Saprolegnia parasitica CBS 223.65]|eukprot:XP_012209620.1 hypothetical protein SPRG_21459 [Saprolegnia parasitica CBS 223.65]
MLRTRLKSTLAAVATAAEASPSLCGIPVAPEWGFGPLRCSFAHFAPKNGFRFLFERLHALHACLGPIFRVRFLPFQSYAVSISDPDAVAQIYRHEGAMPQRQIFAFWKLYRDERQWPLGLTNTNEYAEWKKFRLGMSAHLLQPHNVSTWLPRLDAVARDVAARIESQARASPSGDVPMTLTTKAFTLEAVSSIVFGKRMGCLSRNPSTPVSAPAKAFIRAVDGFFETTQQLMAIPPDAPRVVYKVLPAYKAHVAHVDFIFRLGHDMVREKIASSELRAEPDLLTLFLQRPELSERDAVAQALDVLFAGVDTTSTALLWALYCLATSPNSREMQRKMRAERREILVLQREQKTISYIATQLNRSRGCIRGFLLSPDTYGTARSPGRPSRLSATLHRRLIRSARTGKYTAAELVERNALPIGPRRVCQLLNSSCKLKFKKRPAAPMMTPARKKARVAKAKV